MVDEFPEVLDAVRFKYPDKNVFSYGDKRFFEFAPLYVDKSFFNIFSFRLIKGDIKTALNAPFSLVMTQEIAEKYFGNDDPIGKIVTVNNNENFRVTGIIEKPPSNSHFTFDILASFETLYRTTPREVNGWVYWSYFNQVRIIKSWKPNSVVSLKNTSGICYGKSVQSIPGTCSR